MQLLDTLLDASQKRGTFESMASWFDAFNKQTRQFDRTIERAILGGRLSKNMGFAFASGYQSAVEALFQGQIVAEGSRQIASLCVTEEEGNYPRAIKTCLVEENGRFFLSGNKAFVSGANDAQRMFIACRTGEDDQGRPQLKMVSVPTDAIGVEIKSLPTLKFIPEVSHGSVSLDRIELSSAQILKDDGYTHYVKPFRTYEDLHVLAAVLGYRLGEAIDSGWSQDIIQAHLPLILAIRALGDMDLSQATVHISLAACRDQLMDLIEKTDSVFEQYNPQHYRFWLRDKVLLKVAIKAHKLRTEKAWNHLSIIK